MISSDSQRMFSLLRQFLSENADRMNEQQRVEELNDFIVDGVDAQLFNVNDHQFLSVLFQEVQSSLIQRTVRPSLMNTMKGVSRSVISTGHGSTRRNELQKS